MIWNIETKGWGPRKITEFIKLLKKHKIKADYNKWYGIIKIER